MKKTPKSMITVLFALLLLATVQVSLLGTQAVYNNSNSSGGEGRERFSISYLAEEDQGVQNETGKVFAPGNTVEIKRQMKDDALSTVLGTPYYQVGQVVSFYINDHEITHWMANSTSNGSGLITYAPFWSDDNGAGWYEVLFQIPALEDWSTFGIPSVGGNITIMEWFEGNRSDIVAPKYLDSYSIANSTITVGGYGNLDLVGESPSGSPPTFSQGVDYTVDYKTADVDGNAIPNIPVSVNLYDNVTKLEIANNTNGVQILASEPSLITDASGLISFIVKSTLTVTPQAIYSLNVTADYGSDVHLGRDTVADKTYSHTYFRINNGIATLSITQQFENPNTSNSNIVKQGQKATAIFHVIGPDTNPLNNVPMNWTVINRTDSSVLSSGERTALGINVTAPSTTDSSGNAAFEFNTTFPVTTQQYYIVNITANYTQFGYWASSKPNSHLESLTATVRVLNGNATLIVASAFNSIVSGSSTIRQGLDVNATFIIQDQWSVPVPNVPISIDLINQSSTLSIPKASWGSFGITVTNSTASGTTDLNGEIEFSVNTTYPLTPEHTYVLEVTGNLTGHSSGVWGDPPTNTVDITSNFNVLNVYDDAQLILVDLKPAGTLGDPLNPPTNERSIMILRVEVTDAYTSAFSYPSGIPVNLTLDGSFPGVTIGGVESLGFTVTNGYTQTNATGYVVFEINATFPEVFRNTTPTFTAVANMTYPQMGDNYDPPKFNNDTIEQQFVIAPPYLIGSIVFIGHNHTDTILRPGDVIELSFEVQNQLGNPIPNVPVNVALSTTGGSLAGISSVYNLSINPVDAQRPTYHNTSAGPDGIFNITIVTTYGVTEETSFTLNLDLTADFENDSQALVIGSNHAQPDTVANNWFKTWSTATYNLNIDHQYIDATIAYFSTNHTGLMIRPGEALEITYRVTQGGTGLANVPVNVTMVSNYAGVNLSYTTVEIRPYYAKTDSSGYVTVIVNTTLWVTPKTLTIDLNATADFENDTGNSVWIVGSTYAPETNRSKASWSSTLLLTKVTVDPQVRTAVITLFAQNTTQIQQTETTNLTFVVQSGSDFLPNVNVSLIFNPSWNFNITNTGKKIWKLTDVNGIVSFAVRANGTGETPEGLYSFTARADLENDTALFFLIQGEIINGIWVNGTKNVVNLSYSTAAASIRVKNQKTITTSVLSSSDATPGRTVSPTAVARGGGKDNAWEAHRNTTQINVTGVVKDAFQNLVPSGIVTIYINDSANAMIIPATGTNATVNNGRFSVNITLPGSVMVEDVWIYADNISDAEEAHVGDEIRVVSGIRANPYDITFTSGVNTLVGENLTISGSLWDDQNKTVTTANSGVNVTDLTDHLRIVAWNGTHEISSALIGSPDGNGDFSFSFEIPSSYTGSTLFIRFNVTEDGTQAHFRASMNQTLVLVYQSISYSQVNATFSAGGSLEDIANETTIDIRGASNRSVDLEGIILDNHGRPLAGKNVTIIWNMTNVFKTSTDSNGIFTFSLLPINGWENTTFNATIFHTSFEGKILQNHFLNFTWTIYDITKPVVTITNINFNRTTGELYIEANATDPGILDSGVTSSGLNPSSVSVTIAGSLTYGMTYNATSKLFEFYYDVSGNLTTIISNVDVSAADNAGNKNNHTVRDNSAPTIVFDGTTYDLVGTELRIQVNVTDKGTWSFGINESTVSILISKQTFDMAFNSTTGLFEYYWDNSVITGANPSITVNASDHANNLRSETLSDTTKPSIQFPEDGAPVEVFEHFKTIRINATLSDLSAPLQFGLNQSTVQIRIGSGAWTDMTYDTSLGQFYYDWDPTSTTNQTESITVNVTALDNAGNRNFTLWSIVVDATEPSLALIYSKTIDDVALPGTDGIVAINVFTIDTASSTGLNLGINTSSVSVVLVNQTAGSQNLLLIPVSQQPGNFTAAWNTSDTIFTQADTWIITLNVTDLGGNYKEISQTVYLDIYNPTVVVISPVGAEGTTINSRLSVNETLNVSFIIRDIGVSSGINNGTAFIKNMITTDTLSPISVSNSSTNSSYFVFYLLFDTENLGNGNTDLYINATDFAGNSVTNKAYYLRIQNVPPPTSVPPTIPTTPPLTNTTAAGPSGASIPTIIIFDILALGLGVGIAAGWETVLKPRLGR